MPFVVEDRALGASKFSYRKLTRFALDGLMSFSTLPLMVWTWVGTVISVFALCSAIYFVGQTMMFGVDVPGFASLIVSVTFLAGIQLLSLGVIGEYIGRIFAEVKDGRSTSWRRASAAPRCPTMAAGRPRSAWGPRAPRLA